MTSHPSFTIEEMTERDIEPAIRVLHLSWLDTYVNDDLGVTREWIEARNQLQLTPERVAKRQGRFHDVDTAGWIAKDGSGRIIGVTMPYRDEERRQHVGALYVDRHWHGKGVGSALMQKVIDWFNPSMPIELGVATYNQRAQAFYQKWGFEEVPNSERLFADKIPEIRMVRKADT